MNDDFNYRCRPRSGRRRTPLASKENFGAGSGGEWYDGGHDHHYDGAYQVSSPCVTLVTDGPQPAGKAPSIQLLARANESVDEGNVVVHGDTRVRITTGNAPLQDTNPEGFCVEVDRDQFIGIYHGQWDDGWGSLEMSSEDGVCLSAARDNEITLTAASRITLEVAGGTSSICLERGHISINGPVVFINSDPPPEPGMPTLPGDDPWPDY